MSVPLWLWFAVLAVILVMLAIDLLAHRGERVVSLREAAVWSAVWVSSRAGLRPGRLADVRFGGGRRVLRRLRHREEPGRRQRLRLRAHLRGLRRAPGLPAPGPLLRRARCPRHAGVRSSPAAPYSSTGSPGSSTCSERSSSSPASGCSGRATPTPTRPEHRRAPPHAADHPEHAELARLEVLGTENGRWLATPLFTVLVLVETTDLVFAVDSIPAIFAVTQDPFLVFTSNAFAILGLRAHVLPARGPHAPVRLPQGRIGRGAGVRRRQDAAPRRLQDPDHAVAQRDRRARHRVDRRELVAHQERLGRRLPAPEPAIPSISSGGPS